MRKILSLVVLSGVLLAGCDQAEVTPQADRELTPRVTVDELSTFAGKTDGDLEDRAQEYLQRLNEELAAAGANYAVHSVEWITGDGSDEAGQTVFANDRQKRLTNQWVPNDARRFADGDKITHMIYEPFEPANYGTAAQIPSAPSIDASFDTWENVQCSKLDLEKRADTGVFPSAIFIGGDPFVADVVTLGFLPGFFFDLVLGPGASSSVLGVTFSFIWIDVATGDPTDVNSDGYADTALKEVWYNDAFLWTVDDNPGVDIETVAFHENGHALGLGHFGKVSVGNSNGKLHVSPRAAMNAFILGVQRDPLGTDNASYCSIYANWP